MFASSWLTPSWRRHSPDFDRLWACRGARGAAEGGAPSRCEHAGWQQHTGPGDIDETDWHVAAPAKLGRVTCCEQPEARVVVYT